MHLSVAIWCSLVLLFGVQPVCSYVLLQLGCKFLLLPFSCCRGCSVVADGGLVCLVFCCHWLIVNVAAIVSAVVIAIVDGWCLFGSCLEFWLCLFSLLYVLSLLIHP